MGNLHPWGFPALRVHDIHEVHSFPPVTWRLGVIAKWSFQWWGYLLVFIYIVYTILCRWLFHESWWFWWICTTGLYYFIVHYSFQTYLFKICGVYTYRTAVHLNQGTNGWVIPWSTRIPPASKHLMYYRLPWLHCYQWHSDVGRPDNTRKTNCKGSIPRAALMTPDFRTSVVSWRALQWKLKDVSNLFWVFIFSYLAGSSLMRSIVRSAPPQWWQPGVLPPMSRCPQWHWSQCCRTPLLPVMPWTFSDWISF